MGATFSRREFLRRGAARCLAASGLLSLLAACTVRRQASSAGALVYAEFHY